MPLGDVPRRRISVFRRRSDQPPELELESLAPELELDELEDDDEESLAPELDELELLEFAPELDELPYPPLELESLAPELELELELEDPLELELDESAAAPPELDELDELLEPDDELDEWPLELAELLLFPELRSLPSESALAKPMVRAPFFCVMRVWFLPFDLLSETQL